MRGMRKDHTLLRDDQLQDALLDNEEEREPKEERATIFRLLGLARKEVWVSQNWRSMSTQSVFCSLGREFLAI